MKKRIVLSVALMLSLSVFADVLNISTPRTTLLLQADKSDELKVIYYGTKLSDADAKTVEQTAKDKFAAYPVYGMNGADEAALSVLHADGNMSLQMVVQDTETKKDGDARITVVKMKDRVYPFFVNVFYKAYDNVILHIASVIDTKVTNSSGRDVPQMKLECPPHLLDRYRELSESLHYPACFSSVGQIPPIKIHGWLNSLCIERLSAKSERIEAYQQATNSDWENSLFIALARNFGFGVNGEAFELWAKNVPYGALGKHRDNLLQIEAIFFGQAGFLDENHLPKAYKDAIVNDEYFKRLSAEYRFLSAKFGLKPIEPHLWKYLRMRPATSFARFPPWLFPAHGRP